MPQEMGFHRQRTMWLWRNPDNVTHRQLLSIDQVWRQSTALTWSRWGCRRLADNIWLLAHDNNNTKGHTWKSESEMTKHMPGHITTKYRDCKQWSLTKTSPGIRCPISDGSNFFVWTWHNPRWLAKCHHASPTIPCLRRKRPQPSVLLFE